MKYGAIDIGTNSMRLLLAEKRDNQLFDLHKYVNTTRLGSSIDKDGKISREGIDKNIKALIDYKKIADEYGCQKLFCIGTAGLRNAINSDEFVLNAKEKAKVDVEIIDGTKEAYLGYIGVTSGINLGDDLVLIIDIGGGSTEFIFGNSKEIFFRKSLNIGALLLTEKYISTMPESEVELNALCKYIEKEVSYLYSEMKDIFLNKIESSSGIVKLIGIGGTITQASAIYQEMETYSREQVHLSVIKINEIIRQIETISDLTIEKRREIKGLQPKRAEIIVTGEIILKTIMDIFGFNEIVVSEYDNLEGLIIED